MCLVYVLNMVNHFYYNSGFHASMPRLKYKTDTVDFKIRMVKHL